MDRRKRVNKKRDVLKMTRPQLIDRVGDLLENLGKEKHRTEFLSGMIVERDEAQRTRAKLAEMQDALRKCVTVIDKAHRAGKVRAFDTKGKRDDFQRASWKKMKELAGY